MFIKYIFILTLIFLIAGCGGGSSSDSKTDSSTSPIKTMVNGKFVDAEVEGITYTCASSSEKKFTTSDGEYSCNEGDEVTFSLGSFVLGKVKATKDAVVTPYTLFPDNEKAALNVARVLQTLDSDGDPDNGISLEPISTERFATQAKESSFELTDFSSGSFETKIADFLPVDKELVSIEVALSHLQKNLAKYSEIEDSIETYIVKDSALVEIHKNRANTKIYDLNLPTQDSSIRHMVVYDDFFTFEEGASHNEVQYKYSKLTELKKVNNNVYTTYNVKLLDRVNSNLAYFSDGYSYIIAEEEGSLRYLLDKEESHIGIFGTDYLKNNNKLYFKRTSNNGIFILDLETGVLREKKNSNLSYNVNFLGKITLKDSKKDVILYQDLDTKEFLYLDPENEDITKLSAIPVLLEGFDTKDETFFYDDNNLLRLKITSANIELTPLPIPNISDLVKSVKIDDITYLITKEGDTLSKFWKLDENLVLISLLSIPEDVSHSTITKFGNKVLFLNKIPGNYHFSVVMYDLTSNTHTEFKIENPNLLKWPIVDSNKLYFFNDHSIISFDENNYKEEISVDGYIEKTFFKDSKLYFTSNNKLYEFYEYLDTPTPLLVRVDNYLITLLKDKFYLVYDDEFYGKELFSFNPTTKLISLVKDINTESKTIFSVESFNKEKVILKDERDNYSIFDIVKNTIEPLDIPIYSKIHQFKNDFYFIGEVTFGVKSLNKLTFDTQMKVVDINQIEILTDELVVKSKKAAYNEYKLFLLDDLLYINSSNTSAYSYDLTKNIENTFAFSESYLLSLQNNKYALYTDGDGDEFEQKLFRLNLRDGTISNEITLNGLSDDGFKMKNITMNENLLFVTLKSEIDSPQFWFVDKNFNIKEIEAEINTNHVFAFFDDKKLYLIALEGKNEILYLYNIEDNLFEKMPEVTNLEEFFFGIIGNDDEYIFENNTLYISNRESDRIAIWIYNK